MSTFMSDLRQLNPAAIRHRAEETIEAIRGAGGDGLAIECDVASQEGNERMVAAAVECWRKLDVFCANAGMMSCGPLRDVAGVRLPLLRPAAAHQTQRLIDLFAR